MWRESAQVRSRRVPLRERLARKDRIPQSIRMSYPEYEAGASRAEVYRVETPLLSKGHVFKRE